MARFSSILLGIVAVLFNSSPLYAYSGGSGSPEDPYHISSVADWQEFMAASADWSKSFILTTDLDLAGVILTPIGNFTGLFDGKGHILSNVIIDQWQNSFVGLFQSVGSTGQITNLNLVNADIGGNESVGGLVAENLGMITSCSVTGSIHGYLYIGGLVGGNSGTITDCSVDVLVNGAAYVGGLCRINGSNGMIISCSFNGSVVGNYGGGIVGENTGSITDCLATGSVSGSHTLGIPDCIGGLVGINSGTLTSSYSTCGANGLFSVGGLVGRNGGGITFCHATGSVCGHYSLGGLVGENSGSISDCFATGTIYGEERTEDVIHAVISSGLGGLVGRNSGTIISCYAEGSISGAGYEAGGLVGGNSGTITDCCAFGTTTRFVLDFFTEYHLYSSYFGGLCGYNDNSGIITSCWSTGNVNGDYCLGGLVGWNSGKITSCYAKGLITGSNYNPITEDGSWRLGGLVGSDSHGQISFCFSTGTASGTDSIGGLIGRTENSTITACFWDMQTSGLTTSAGGTGKTTAEMQMLSTFINTGWDFVGETRNGTLDTWLMPKNDYPFLTWQWPHQVYVVDAGPDVLMKYPPDRLQLAGNIEGDIEPSVEIEIKWSLISGPSAVSFDPNENILDPTVILSLPGEYILRLTVDDGVFQSPDDMKITYSYGIFFVDSSATGSNTGSSWENAFTSLQDALTLAVAGTEIRVAQGIYRPDQFNLLDRVSLGRLETYALKSTVSLKGGYAGTTAPNPDDRDTAKYPTILSGDLSGNDNPNTPLASLRADPSRNDNSYHVVTAMGVDSTALLDGFTITGGHANSATAPDYRGGGLNIDNASPAITNCSFTACTATYGGAVCARNASNAAFTACRFAGNAAVSGGAVLNDSKATYADCDFTGNYAVYGGGLCASSSAQLVRSLIAQNIAASDGGGFYNNITTATALTNCTLADNSAGRSGGGFFSVPAGKFSIANSILWGNKAAGVTGKAAQLTGGTAAIYHSTIQDWYGDDPLFTDPAAGDYRLKSKAGRYDPSTGDWVMDDTTSPAIDAGSPFDPVSDEPTPNGGRINQGFDGGTEYASKSPDRNTADLNRDGKVNLMDFAIVAENWLWED